MMRVRAFFKAIPVVRNTVFDAKNTMATSHVQLDTSMQL